MWSLHRPAPEVPPGAQALHPRSTDDDGIAAGGALRLVRRTASSEVFLLKRLDGQAVAAKRLLPRWAARRPELISRERLALQRFAGAGLVDLADAGFADPQRWVITEFLACGDLRSLAGAPPARWLPLLLQPLRWLVDLHAAGFVHGDLKASHFMLRSPAQACLIDLASLRRQGGLRAPASVVLPEDTDRASTAADVFAFGTMLQELAEGAGVEPALQRLAAACCASIPRYRPALDWVYCRLRDMCSDHRWSSCP